MVPCLVPGTTRCESGYTEIPIRKQLGYSCRKNKTLRRIKTNLHVSLGISRKRIAVFWGMRLARLAFVPCVALCTRCTSPDGSRNVVWCCTPLAQPLVANKLNIQVCPPLPKRNTFLSISPERHDIQSQPSASLITSWLISSGSHVFLRTLVSAHAATETGKANCWITWKIIQNNHYT